MVGHTSDATFKTDVLAEKLPVLVDFWAQWCGPCRMLAPVLDKLSDKFAGRLKIVKLDTDANPETAQAYQISGVPSCVLFKDGAEVTRFVGHRNEATFSADLESVLGA